MTSLLSSTNPTPLLVNSSECPKGERSDEIAHYELHCFDDILDDIGLYVDEDMNFCASDDNNDEVPMTVVSESRIAPTEPIPNPLKPFTSSEPVFTTGPQLQTKDYEPSAVGSALSLSQNFQAFKASPTQLSQPMAPGTPQTILAPLAPSPSPRCVGAMHQSIGHHPSGASYVSAEVSDHEDDHLHHKIPAKAVTKAAVTTTILGKRKDSPDQAEDLDDEQLAERRERNRQHARKSRARKKVLTENLESTVQMLQEENKKLRMQITSMFGQEKTESMIYEKLNDPNEQLIASLKKPSNKTMDAESLKFLQDLRKNVPLRSIRSAPSTTTTTTTTNG